MTDQTTPAPMAANAAITSGDTVTLPRSLISEVIAALHKGHQFGVAGTLADAIISPKAAPIMSGEALNMIDGIAAIIDTTTVVPHGTKAGVVGLLLADLRRYVQRATEIEQALDIAISLQNQAQSDAERAEKELARMRAGAADKPVAWACPLDLALRPLETPDIEWGPENNWADQYQPFPLFRAPVAATADAAPAGAVAELSKPRWKAGDFEAWAPVYTEQEVANIVRALKSAPAEVTPATKVDSVPDGCQHRSATALYDVVQCDKCGAVKTDNGWGIASNQWFASKAVAEFYRQHGRLPIAAQTNTPADASAEADKENA